VNRPTVGILGGGQLARMMALCGAALGVRFRIMDTAADACAGQVAELVHADFTDREALAAFAASVDVVTFDFENVPAASAEYLAEHVPVFPNPRALALAQDRLEEKRLFRSLGMDTPAFEAVDSRDGLAGAVARIGLPAILKTRRLGYDGKGQFRLRSPGDVDAAWDALGGVPLILEQFVPFERELSVVAVRARSGAFAAYPLTRNWHADGILSASLSPVAASTGIEQEVDAFARRLAESLDYVGTFAVEFFQHQGRLLANEMAPRVHNSGHWTIEGAETSQFENHVRAVLGWPLGGTGARASAAMLNWIGSLPERDAVLSSREGHWHDYGKSARAGRKVGHATCVAADARTLAYALAALGVALDREGQVAPLLAALGEGAERAA